MENSSEEEDEYNKKKYEEIPIIKMRDTDKKIVDYEKLRKDQMKNLDSLYENIDSKLFDEDGLK